VCRKGEAIYIRKDLGFQYKDGNCFPRELGWDLVAGGFGSGPFLELGHFKRMENGQQSNTPPMTKLLYETSINQCSDIESMWPQSSQRLVIQSLI
jgi:hypothetical protein